MPLKPALRKTFIQQICLKIIFLLRDPLDRAFSQYRMATNKGNIHHQIPFAKAFQENMQYMKRRGNYLETINEYLSAGFSIDNFLFVNFELIEADPQELMRQVGNFLGISFPRVIIYEQNMGQQPTAVNLLKKRLET